VVDKKTGRNGKGERVRRMAQHVLRLANSAVPRTDFMTAVVELVMDLTGATGVEFWLEENGGCARFRAGRGENGALSFELAACGRQQEGAEDGVEPIPCGDGTCPLDPATRVGQDPTQAVVPLTLGKDITGWLQVSKLARGPFSRNEIAWLGRLAETLGIALVNQRAQAALRERVKELTGLYAMAQLVERPDMSLEELLENIANLLPPAWQYPEITVGRVLLDGRCHASAASWEGVARQAADIVVGGRNRGLVEVTYLEPRPQLDEGPFLKEERSLLNAIAREIAGVVERRQAREEKARLENQLRHADRLATIGQLAAGVAHELNEPLGAVLGFAQLARKAAGIQEGVEGDLRKIEAGALHAREIVRKLMLFARQSPPRKVSVDLNQVVRDGLLFLESRWAKKGVDVRRELAADLPSITADSAQLQQVLVNLVVNAEHAMPDGGTLTIATQAAEGRVLLRVTDTGVGMSEEVKAKVFLPFFTTKEVNEGTGLGLSVVHGIVSSHGGTIRVTSEVGMGSTFEVELPVGELTES